MKAVLAALARALPLLFDPRLLLAVLLPLTAAAVGFVVLLFAAWSPLQDWLAALLARWLAFVGLGHALDAAAAFGAGLVAFVLLGLSAGALALAAIAVFAGPLFVRVVATRHFPDLERRRGGSFAGGFANAAVTLLLWLPMWLVVVPLWFVPGLGLALSLLVSAWLNQRLFRYDALAEHASADELAAVVTGARWRLLGLGLLLAPLALVPFANLAAPLLAGLAFTELCLAELAALRRPGPIERGETT